MIEEMRSIESQFKASTGLEDRRHFKIFYSHIHRFPLLVLGQNPGGETDGTELSASSSFFENWEHDFVFFRNEPRYPLARPTFEMLSIALQTTSLEELRQVPATNVIFRRSRNTESLNIPTAAAAKEALPMLSRILKIVHPKVILFVSSTAYDLFIALHCKAGSAKNVSDELVYTANGRYSACIFKSTQTEVLGLSHLVALFMVGHPSKYARRSEWSRAVQLLREGFKRCEISPMDPSAFTAIPRLQSDG